MDLRYSCKFVHIDNCGPPITIDEGWLVFTYDTGIVRGYCVGTSLLDKANPTKVLARNPSSMLSRSVEQRSGYIPNVTYS